VKGEYKPLPDMEAYYSSGSRDLDEILGGGWLKGSMNILEVGADVGLDAYRSIVLATGLNFVMKGRMFLAYDPPRLDADYLRGYLEPFIGEEEFGRLVRCSSTDSLGSRILEEAPSETPAYTFLSLDALTYRYGESQALKVLLRLIERVRRRREILLLGVPDGELQPKLVNVLSKMAKVHLKMTEMDGVALIYGAKPRTGYYILEIEPSKGFPELRFTPIL